SVTTLWCPTLDRSQQLCKLHEPLMAPSMSPAWTAPPAFSRWRATSASFCRLANQRAYRQVRIFYPPLPPQRGLVRVIIRAGSFLVWRELEQQQQRRYCMEGQLSRSVHQGHKGSRSMLKLVEKSFYVRCSVEGDR